MPRYTDPVLNALFELQAEAERTCPTPVQITTAALSGTAALPPALAEHLLRERCEDCERWLDRTWSRTHSPPHVLVGAEHWPKEGALRTALDRHALTCPEPACHEYAKRTGLIAPKRKTAVQRVGEWFAPVRATLHGVVLRDDFAAGQLNAARGSEPEVLRPGEEGWFGANVHLAPSAGELLLTVHTDRIANVHGRSLVLAVFVIGAEQPLALLELGPPSGTWTARIAAPERLEWAKLRVAIGVVDV
jgi:hypothetical protein